MLWASDALLGRRSLQNRNRPDIVRRPAFGVWPTIRPLVPVNTRALLGSNGLILPL